MMKILTFLLLFALCFTLTGCLFISPKTETTQNQSDTAIGEETKTTTEAKTEEMQNSSSDAKSIDLYIIAGQSNAGGHTIIDERALATLWKDYAVGSKNVLYRGTAEYTVNENTANPSTGKNEIQHWTSAKKGYGIFSNRMGPEVGLAAKLSKTYYTDNKTAGIIKYAHGGTSIFNNTQGQNADNGNWVSPSYAKAKNIAHSGLTGNLYRNLVKTVEESIAQLESQKYEQIKIKGIFWMQGESDRGNPQEYATALKFFIDDIRGDLSKLTDQSPTEITFMIGEISETSGGASTAIIENNKKFISYQRSVANKANQIYMIPSSQYHINWLDENGNNHYIQDQWHWGTEHMFRVGEHVADCILKNVLNQID